MHFHINTNFMCGVHHGQHPWKYVHVETFINIHTPTYMTYVRVYTVIQPIIMKQIFYLS